MAREPRPESTGVLPLRTPIIVVLCLLATGLAAASSAQAAATGPYEPNDVITRAYGPLTANTPINAAVEAPNDPDWYYVMTSGPGPVELSLTLNGCSALTACMSTAMT